MPVKLQYESEPAGIVGVFSGIVTGKDLISINQEASECQECLFQLWDFTAVSSLTVSPKEVHQIALQDRLIPKNAKLSKVALVGSREIFSGIDEVYHIFSEKWVGRNKRFQSQTFEAVKDARLWLKGN